MVFFLSDTFQMVDESAYALDFTHVEDLFTCFKMCMSPVKLSDRNIIVFLLLQY